MATSLPTSPDGFGIAAVDRTVHDADRWTVAFAVPGDLTGPDGILQGGLSAALPGAAVLAGPDGLDPRDVTTVHARLRRPTPVGALLHVDVEREDATDFAVTVRNGDEVVVTATVEVAGPPPVPHLPDLLELGRAPVPPARPDHPYGHCFVCGAENPRGLHVAPHPVAGLGRNIAPWTPDERVDDGAGHVHWLATSAVLDCPGVWAGFSQLGHPGLDHAPAGDADRQVALLADYRLQVFEAPPLGESCRTVGLVDDVDGRQLWVRTGLVDARGRLLALATAMHVLVGAMPDAPTPATPLDGRA